MPSPGRVASSPKKSGLMSKFVQSYEEFFKVNVEFLEAQFAKKSVMEIVEMKESVSFLVERTINFMHNANEIRVANALLTLGVVLKALFQKQLAKQGYNLIEYLFGFEPEETVKRLFVCLEELLAGRKADVLRGLSLAVLSIIVTGTEVISQNGFMEYLMLQNLFRALVELFRQQEVMRLFGRQAMFLLSVLINYRKHEIANPYAQGLQGLSDDVLLNGLGSCMIRLLSDRNRRWTAAVGPRASGFLASITDMVGSMFIAAESASSINASAADRGGCLLMLYETVYQNPNFLIVLTHTEVTSPSSAADSSSSAASAGQPASPTEAINLLSSFLTFCSFTLSNTHDEEGRLYARLCFVILMCMTEDAHANTFIHDTNVKVPVMLHRAAMRHRPASVEPLPSGTLSAAVLDLCIEFLVSHLQKKFLTELYLKCLAVIHRLLCHQKRQRVRLSFPWKKLWEALVNLVRFLLANEKRLGSDTFVLSSQVLTIFNLFITYGDTFLPDPDSYDQLYYEIIRVHQVFDNLYDSAKRCMRREGPEHDLGAKVASDLVNVKAITNHFNPKLKLWSDSHEGAALTPEQVLAIVKKNYESLTLKLQDSLDSYDKYSDTGNEAGSLSALVRGLIKNNQGTILRVEQPSVSV